MRQSFVVLLLFLGFGWDGVLDIEIIRAYFENCWVYSYGRTLSNSFCLCRFYGDKNFINSSATFGNGLSRMIVS